MKNSVATRGIVVGGWLVAGFGHLLAVATLATLSVLCFVPVESVERIIGWLLEDQQLLDATAWDLALHVALCACLWAFVFLIFSYVRQRLRTLRKVSLTPTRGTVITETLIVMPVFLLMTFGMSQLVVNSIAGVLMNVAAFQAGRAYWVWQPEESGGRADGASAEDRARIAAAAVMTPVAPGGFGSNVVSEVLNFGTFPDDASAMRTGLAASNLPFSEVIPSDTSGTLADLASVSFSTERSFWRALDSQTFLQRSITKFTFAYESTSVEAVTEDGRLGVTVTYLHLQAMPVTGAIFGDELGGLFGGDAPGDVKGYYATYERTYSYPAQLAIPNSNMPDAGTGEPIPSGGAPSEDDLRGRGCEESGNTDPDC